MSARPAAASASTADATTIAFEAASELARLLPSAVPLEVAAFDASAGPAPDALAVRASFVGGTSADFVVVAAQEIATALDGAGTPIQLEDALRPALEAASATLGAGVLDTTSAAPVGEALLDGGMATFALVSGGVPHAWFGMRLRTRQAAVPHQKSGPATASERAGMRLLQDVEMTLTAEIGRTRLPVRQVLELVPGTVLELDRAAGSPADIMVNGRLVARGEVVVVDEDYGIRITEIVATDGVV